MARAGRALLLLCVVAVALPLLVQGYIPVNTYRRQRGDNPAGGDSWRRSSSLGGAGDVHPVHHLPKNFRHRFIHRHGKVLLENAEGRPQGFELHPQWERRFHEHHHKDGEDFRLAGEHHQHHHDHARFRHRHERDALPARVMKEENAEENHGIFQRLTERLLEKSVGPKAAGPSGVWNDLKSKMSDGVSGLASKVQTVGDRIKSWFSTSSSRVAPSISFSAEPAWLGPLTRESPSASSACSIGVKLSEVVHDLTVMPVQEDSSPAGSAGTCAGMLEGRTRLLKHTLKKRIESLCAVSSNSPCEVEFCNFFSRHPKLTTVMVLDKLGVQPVNVVLKHDHSICNDGEADEIVHHLLHIKRRLSMKLNGWALKLNAEGSSVKTTPKEPCQACFDQKFHQIRHVLHESLAQVCEKTTCAKMKNACVFVKEHKHLARSFLMQHLRPWEMAAKTCASVCPKAPFPESMTTEEQRSSEVGQRSALSEVSENEATHGLQHFEGSHTGIGCKRLRRAMQLRGFGPGFFPEVSRFLQGADGAGMHHPHMVIVELVRQEPVDPQEVVASMRLVLQQQIDALLQKHFDGPYAFGREELQLPFLDVERTRPEESPVKTNFEVDGGDSDANGDVAGSIGVQDGVVNDDAKDVEVKLPVEVHDVALSAEQ